MFTIFTIALKLPLKIGIGLALAAVAGGLAFWKLPARAPSIRLGDGSVVTLEFVSYEQRNPAVRRQTWMGKAQLWLAQKLGRPTFSSRPVVNDCLVYWISRREKGTGRYLGFDWLSHAVAVDSHGCTFDSTPIMLIHTHNWAAGARPLPQPPSGAKYILVSGELPVFPRREKTFKLRVYDRQLQLAGEFEVTNPMYRLYPTWKAQDLSIMRSAEDLQASLVGLTNRWRGASYDGLKLRRFSLTPEILTTADWELSDLEVEDATGNRGPGIGPFSGGSPRMPHWVRNKRPVSAEFRLCTNETAWKLHATFCRTAEAQFTPNETWTVPHLAIPAAATARVLSGSNAWQGVTVSLCAVAGPGRISYSNGVPVSAAEFTGGGGGGGGNRMAGGVLVSDMWVSTDKPQVMVHISGLTERSRFQCLAKCGGATYVCPEAGNANNYKLLQLNVPDGTDWVDLTFVIQQPRLIDFFIRPQAPQEK